MLSSDYLPDDKKAVVLFYVWLLLIELYNFTGAIIICITTIKQKSYKVKLKNGL